MRNEYENDAIGFWLTIIFWVAIVVSIGAAWLENVVVAAEMLGVSILLFIYLRIREGGPTSKIGEEPHE